MEGTQAGTFSKQFQKELRDGSLSSFGSFSHRTLRPSFALILALSASVGAPCQDHTGSERLADSVRSLNRQLEAAPRFDRAALLPSLVERAGELVSLMVRDPRAAISLALPAEETTRLSWILPDAVDQIELRGQWQGPMTVIVEDDFASDRSRTRFWMETGGARVEVHFADNPAGLASGEIATVRGIRLGNHIAATLAGISPGAAGASTCGPLGEQKIAVVMIEFPGVPFPTSVVTPAELHEMYFSNTQASVDAYWREASYGQTSATGDVFGPFMLDRGYDFFTQQFEGLQAAINAADSTVDFTVYNHVVVIWPLPGVSGWGGSAGVGCLTGLPTRFRESPAGPRSRAT